MADIEVPRMPDFPSVLEDRDGPEVSVDSGPETLEWQGPRMTEDQKFETVLYVQQSLAARIIIETPDVELEVSIKYPDNPEYDSNRRRQLVRLANDNVRKAVELVMGGTPWDFEYSKPPTSGEA